MDLMNLNFSITHHYTEKKLNNLALLFDENFEL